ncbi:MAG TPA: RDD family protein [Prosthecobacter sp.]|jgi:uncharacterized RDD family membrane protein YckC|nr:RDD family protein [Prosthecobacter sp.]
MASSEVYHLKWKGQRSGPFSLHEIEEKLQRREVSSLHEVEVDGKWITVRAFMARHVPPTAYSAAVTTRQGGSLPPPAILASSVPGPPASAPRDGRPVSVPPPVPASRQAPSHPWPSSMEQPVSRPAASSDGNACLYLRSNFTLRVIAILLDVLVFLVGIMVMQKLRWVSLGTPPALQDIAKIPDGLWVAAWLLACWAGGILMEGSPLQATLGKWMLGLAVVDQNGLPLSTGNSFKRGTLRLLGALPFGLGWFMAAFNQEARTMHDLVADTHVVLRVRATRIFH